MRIELGVLGDPLTFTLSPALHRAGLAALGLAGSSEPLRTPREALGPRLRELAGRGFRGVNLTHPLKEEALAHVARVSAAARRARSINTVHFDAEGASGDTTDGPGFLDLLRSLGREPAGERVVLLGGGGAARSLATALLEAGATVTLSVRAGPPREPSGGAGEPARVAWRSAEERESIAAAGVVVNATPLAGAEEPAPLALIPRRALVVDLVYGERPTAWVVEARAQGIEAWDGLGLLVFQARRSLSIWTGAEIPLAPLARAVGWPR